MAPKYLAFTKLDVVLLLKLGQLTLLLGVGEDRQDLALLDRLAIADLQLEQPVQGPRHR